MAGRQSSQARVTSSHHVSIAHPYSFCAAPKLAAETMGKSPKAPIQLTAGPVDQVKGGCMRRMDDHALACLIATVAVTLPTSQLGRADGKPSTAKIGQKISNVSLPDISGKIFSLYDFKDKKAIVALFLSFDCPVARSYGSYLTELARQYGDRGVAFVAYCPCEEDAEMITRHAREYRIPFPVLQDDRLVAADAFGADMTPQSFVLDGNFHLRYRGRIDNGYAARLQRKAQVTRHDLREALEEVLAGKAVSESATQAVGCPIVRDQPARAESAQVTFNRDILPILQNQCQECHRPGEVGPFSLLTYKQAVRWGPDLKEYTHNRKMPPWKPVNSHGMFRNERGLTETEINRIASWVGGGMPEGDPRDKPAPRRFAEGWQNGEPDMVLEMPEEMIVGPAGRDLMRVFAFPTGFPEEKFLSAIEVRPGNKRVVHHTLYFTDTSGQGRKFQEAERKRVKNADEQDRGPGYSATMGLGFLALPPKVILLSGWAPGMLYRPMPEGVGYRLPRGADVLLQIHYHRTGREEHDRTRIGLYFARKPVDKPVHILPAPGLFTMIPPGQDRYKVEGRIWIDQDIVIHYLMPHMHLLGKEIKATVTRPDGQMQTLVWIKDWDFNWQEFYFLKEPLKIPAGSRFDVVSYYDNTERNPVNPYNPPRPVFVGEETTNEMSLVFMGCTTDGSRSLLLPRFADPGIRKKPLRGE
jgi:peroxiredoxin